VINRFIKQPLAWHEIDTVLLDMDGTLLDLHFDNIFWLEWVPKAYAQQHHISIEKAKEQLYEQFAQLRGHLNWYCVDYWTQALGLDIESLKKELVHLIHVRPDVEAFLVALKKHHKKIYLVTNAHHKSLSLKMDKTGLADYFNDLITSHHFGVPKENPFFWDQLRARITFDPARTLFIDDSVDVLNSAHAYGIGHVLAIHQPDSQQPPRFIENYAVVEHFRDIMPVDLL
jgi:putative hydrolase of the HAD superfamily